MFLIKWLNVAGTMANVPLSSAKWTVSQGVDLVRSLLIHVFQSLEFWTRTVVFLKLTASKMKFTG